MKELARYLESAIILNLLDKYEIHETGMWWIRVKDTKSGKFYRIEVKELV